MSLNLSSPNSVSDFAGSKDEKANFYVKKWLSDDAISRPDWTKTSSRPTEMLWLDKNENIDSLLLKQNTEILHSLPIEAIFSYPDASLVYKKLALLDSVRPTELRLTPGSDGAIRAVFDLVIQPGDLVIHTAPTFAMYPVYCQIFNARSKTLNYQKSNRGPSLTVSEIIDAVRQFCPKLICLPNPDSPTGTALETGEIEELLWAARSVGALVLIDEAYYPYYSLSCAPLIHNHPNLIVARTFAKAWGLAGLRVGYTIANESLTASLHKIRPMYEVSTIATSFLEVALESPKAMRESVARTIEGKEYFMKAMRTRGFDVLETQGNFSHVSFGKSSASIHRALSDLVLYRKDFSDECLKGYSRFSMASKEKLEVVVQRIYSVLCS